MRVEASVYAHVAAGLLFAAMPMRFKADRVVIAVMNKCFELADPVDPGLQPTGAHSQWASGGADRVFAVAVANAVFGYQLIVVGVGRFAGVGGRVAGVPVEHEVRLADFLEQFGGLNAVARVGR